MDERPDQDLRRFVEHWRTAADFLEKERAQRLRGMTDDECRMIIARLFESVAPVPVERPSGLVEQQRLFRRLR